MRLAFFILLMVSIQCREKCDEITGEWKVVSPFYSASYSIYFDEGDLKCSVLTYNDGTSKYDNRGKSQYFLSEKLLCKDGRHIDGISGATVKLEASSLQLKKISDDTLRVTTLIGDKTITENWIKINTL